MLRRQTIDYPLLIIALLLTAFGIAMVFSAGQTDIPSPIVAGAWKRQIMFFAAALAACWVVSRGSVRLFEWSAWPLYIITCILLAYLLGFGTGAGTASSTKSWLTIAGRRIGQPAELAKLATVLMLARVLASKRDSFRSLMDMWRPLAVIAVPWVLVMLQPDLGTGLGFIGICFAMLFWAGAPWQLLLMLASPGISLVLAFSTGLWGAWFFVLVALVFWYRVWLWEGVVLVLLNAVVGMAAPKLWDSLSPYQQSRILVFTNDPTMDPSGAAYHANQSQIAIGSGGLLGKGFTAGTQKSLGFLPERHTDFIFSVVGEELGFVGVCVALSLFLALFLRCIRVATRANDAFPSLVACGLAALWLVHVIINIGMTLNLMPVTGIPLPFFSYGPSFLLVCWTAVAIVLRISGEGRGKADEVSL
ncbi:MAG: rod shape-determining protein RodA [Phycisphaerae bacterium]|nr:rod shape-determining protein RodA [Gemmatimonadaceae bacterium]